MKATFLLLTALAGAAAGCSDSTGPVLGDGTFVLRSVAGEPVPARIFVGDFGGEYLADTLRFHPLSLAIFSVPTLERAILERLPEGATTFRLEFVEYTRSNDTYSFTYPCSAGEVDCMVGLASGKVTGDTLEVLVHPNSGLRSPLVYERLR